MNTSNALFTESRSIDPLPKAWEENSRVGDIICADASLQIMA